MKIHYPWEWGMTLCGLNGWKELWSGWDAKDSLPNTMDKKKVTCRKCRKALAKGKEKI
jgi:hypothetical protein